MNTSLGSFLKDIDMFDPTEFGVTMKDASSMAVGTRKLLELSFLALLDSGLDYRGRNVGCYMSAVAFDILSVAEPVSSANYLFCKARCIDASRVRRMNSKRRVHFPACQAWSLIAYHTTLT